MSKGFSSILVLSVRLNPLLNVTHLGRATLRTRQFYEIAGIDISRRDSHQTNGHAIAYGIGCQKWMLTGHLGTLQNQGADSNFAP